MKNFKYSQINFISSPKQVIIHLKKDIKKLKISGET